MLHGKLTMREIITKQDGFWEVISGDSMEEDIVVSKKMTEIAENELPYEDSYFCIATPDIQEYLNKVDTKLYIGIYCMLKPMNVNENIPDRAVDYVAGDFYIEVERYTRIFENALRAEFVCKSDCQMQYWKEAAIVTEPMVLNFSTNMALNQTSELEESNFWAA